MRPRVHRGCAPRAAAPDGRRTLRVVRRAPLGGRATRLDERGRSRRAGARMEATADQATRPRGGYPADQCGGDDRGGAEAAASPTAGAGAPDAREGDRATSRRRRLRRPAEQEPEPARATERARPPGAAGARSGEQVMLQAAGGPTMVIADISLRYIGAYSRDDHAGSRGSRPPQGPAA